MRFKMFSVNKELFIYIFRSCGWVSILYFMALLFALPLEVLMAVIEERIKEYNHIQNLFFIHNSIQFALIVVIPVLLAIFLFRFLQVKQHSDFIHSLPVSRKQIYVHHVVAGILFLLIPILVTALILIVFNWTMDVSQLYTLKDIGFWIGITFILEFFIFSAAVFIGMITGLSALQAVLTYIGLLLPVAVVVLFVTNMNLLLFGFPDHYYLSNLSMKLSPLTLATDIEKINLFSIEIVVYLILAICLCFLSFFLYKNRKNEYVSHAFVFPIVKPVFKYGMITGVMLVSGYYFSETSVTMGWILFGYIFGVVVGFLIAEMVLQKTWRIRLKYRGFSIYVAVVAVLVFIIKLDFIGFEAKVPETVDIKKVYIISNTLDYYDDGNPHLGDEMTFLTEAGNMNNLRKLHEQIIEHGDDEKIGSNWKYPSLSFRYELMNGQMVTREYQLHNYEAFTPFFKKIYESQEFKERFYTLLTISPTDVYRVRISGNGNVERSVQLSDPKEIKKALEAIKTDLSNRTYEKMKGSASDYGRLTFILGDNRQISLNLTGSDYLFNEWLQQSGKEEHIRVKAEDLSYMLVEEYDASKDYSSPTFVPQKNSLKVENVDQKKELLNISTLEESGEYVVLLYYKDNYHMEIRRLSDENVPNFISEHFEK